MADPTATAACDIVPHSMGGGLTWCRTHLRLGSECQPATAASDEHTHEWQPNGSVEVSRMAKSPCSTWDDEFWLDVISLAVCRCGAIKRDRIGTKGHYRRGDKLRNQR